MNILKPKQLEEIIINLLSKGERSTTTLLEETRRLRNNATKQGFYQALRNLKRDEIILIYKKIVSLDPVWMSKMREMLDTMTKIYALNQSSFNVIGLEDKESISYSFSNIKNLDAFWGHLQSLIMRNTSQNEPIFSYDPHYWFYVARKEREKELLKEIVENKRQFLMTVGGTAPLDKIIKADFNSDYLQYNHKKAFEREDCYLTIVEEYVIEVYLDEHIVKRVGEIYDAAPDLYENVIGSLKRLLDSPTRNRIKVSRNKAKAEKLKRKLKKDFYIIK